MRSILFVILAVLLAGGGFFSYWLVQPRLARPTGQDDPASAQYLNPNAAAVSGVSGGERPWTRVFDKEGRLSSRFRADDYAPRDDGTVHVKNVAADFFQYPKGRVQRVRIEGKEGDVEVQSSPQGTKGAMEKGSGGPPKRGRLNDVRIQLFDNDKTTVPKITVRTDNIAFDNESFEITTESYRKPDGTVVPADQVPIHVTGDYDFEGRGLKVRWNDLDNRLDYLEVAHGEKLKINHPSALPDGVPGSSPSKTKKATSVAAAIWGDPLLDLGGRPIQLAAADRKAAGAAVQAAGKAEKGKDKDKSEKRPQPPYRATFSDAVRITQGQEGISERDLVAADVMSIDFMLGQEGDKPTTAPSTKPAAVAAPATQPEKAASAAPQQPGTQAATTKPSTQPAEPVIVRWTGPLRIVPIEPSASEPPVGLKPGESVLHLNGTRAPALLTHENNRIRCASLDYYTADGSVAIRNSPQFPLVEMSQVAVPAVPGQTAAAGQDATVTTESVHYSGTERVAVLNGKGRANLGLKPVGADGKSTTKPTALAVKPAAADAPAERMDVQWTREARFFFAPPSNDPVAKKANATPGGGMTIDHATLKGDVDVKHPQLAMKSQALDLLFGRPPPTTAPASPVSATQPAATLAKDAKDAKDKHSDQPTLRRLVATNGVWCELKDPGGKQQTVECQQLSLETAVAADGKVYPRRINADGNAHAYDPTQDLRAGHLELILAPAKPAAGPTSKPSLIALNQPASKPSDAAGGIETAEVELQAMTARDEVRVASADGAVATAAEMFVVMKDGQPHVRLVGRPEAKVVDAKRNTVSGPVITVDPRQNIATVVGRGSLQVLRQEDPAGPPQWMQVAWLHGAELNAPANRVFVRGPVAVVSTDPDGTVNTATGQTVYVELVDRPPPATQTSTRPVTVAKGPTTPAPATGPSTRPVKVAKGNPLGDEMKMDVLKDKAVRAVVLNQDAVVKSSLAAADGSVLRQFQLSSSIIRYEMLGNGASLVPTQPAKAGQPPARTGRLVVPAPGQMLVRDHRPPAEKDKNAKPAADGGGLDPANSRGAVAFQWQKNMVYDEPTSTATMNGNVAIVYKPDDEKEQPARLDADQVVATFEPRVDKDGKPAAKPATRPAGAGGGAMDQPVALQLRWLTARGNLRVTRAGATMTGDQIDYDPATAWMVATGTDRNPATFNDPARGEALSAQQIMWNTQTWQVKAKNIASRGGAGQ